MATILIAPDSFKGSLDSFGVAAAMATGWLSVRPKDTLIRRPLADGGEGTLDVIRAVDPSGYLHRCNVTGPDGEMLTARWIHFPDDHAYMELAECSGLPSMATPDPIGATTRGLGELFGIARGKGVTHVTVGLGGSATTDAGLGALEALGLKVTREGGRGSGIVGVVSLDASALDAGGLEVTVLADTKVTMAEAARVFGPQKGASPDQVEELSEALAHLIELTGDEHTHLVPGSGTAGATAWGLSHFLGATISPGSEVVAARVGLADALQEADLVLTGEGQYDATSHSGKLVGYVVNQAALHQRPVRIIAGAATTAPPEGSTVITLVEQAGSAEEAMSRPSHWIQQASAKEALDFSESEVTTHR